MTKSRRCVGLALAVLPKAVATPSSLGPVELFQLDGRHGTGALGEVSLGRRNLASTSWYQACNLSRIALDALRMGSGDVMPLTEIFGEMIEVDAAVFETFDQFPIAHADRTAGETTLVAVVRIVPIEGLAVEGFCPLSSGTSERPSLCCCWSERQAGHGQHGRIEVGADHRHIAGRSRAWSRPAIESGAVRGSRLRRASPCRRAAAGWTLATLRSLTARRCPT